MQYTTLNPVKQINIIKTTKKRFNYMKVLNPNNLNHSIKFIPRYYPDFPITLTLKNESTNVETIVNCDYTLVNGLCEVHFDYTFDNKSKFQIKIEEENVIFRGKLLITDQGTQDYKITKDLYYYE